MNILRRLPRSRLLLLCGLTFALGIGATALATGLASGPVPPRKPLAQAIHDALAAGPLQGASARIQFTNHLLEGANLASGDGTGGQLASSPLLTGGSGRLWVSKEGQVRLELQSEKGDTEILYDRHMVTLYEPSSNTLYRYTPPQPENTESSVGTPDQHEVPSVAKIQEAISHVTQHANLSEAHPTDVAGQPAYTVRISPSHNGGLIAGAELSFDAVHGVPLRAALYSTSSPEPVLELAATEISYEAVPASVFEFSPPPGAKVQEVHAPEKQDSGSSGPSGSTGEHPKISTHGTGLESIVEVESQVKEGAGKSSPALPEGLQKVQINGASATELPTQLGTLLSFERSGVRYLLLGFVTPATIEAFARGL